MDVVVCDLGVFCCASLCVFSRVKFLCFLFCFGVARAWCGMPFIVLFLKYSLSCFNIRFSDWERTDTGVWLLCHASLKEGVKVCLSRFPAARGGGGRGRHLPASHRRCFVCCFDSLSSQAAPTLVPCLYSGVR